VRSGNAEFLAFVAPGYGLAAPRPAADAARVAASARPLPDRRAQDVPPPPPPAPSPAPVRGIKLELMPEAVSPAADVVAALSALLLLALAAAGGAWRGWRADSDAPELGPSPRRTPALRPA
jgi:cobaltochelatase CobN